MIEFVVDSIGISILKSCFDGVAIFVGIKDLSFLIERKAKDKQVVRNITAKNVVAFTRKEFVLAPKSDSAEANASVRPPPRPDCIRMIVAKRIQTIQ